MRNSKISIVKILILGIAMLMLGNSNVLAQISVSLPNITRAIGSPDEYINVTVGDVTNQNVSSFQFTLFYDKDVMYVTEASTDGLSLTGGAKPVFNADTANGKINVAWAQANPISGAGTLVKLKVVYRNAGTSILSFDDNGNVASTFKFNAGNPAAAITNGTVNLPSLAVNFGDVNAMVGDTVLIPVNVTELKASDNVVSYNFVATFNNAVLKMIDNVTAGTLSEGGTISMNAQNADSKVSVAWAKATSISGAGVLVYLKAVVIGAGTSTMDFTSFKFNTGTPVAATLAGTVTATAVSKYSVTGTVTYMNAVNTPLQNVVVTLTPASGNAMVDTTDANGNYSFGGLEAGTFTLAVAKTAGWGSVNATDALLVSRYFQGLQTFDTLQVLAGDVTNNDQVNNSDALAIVNRYVGKISQFDKPDWTFYPQNLSVTITNANVVQDFEALATGDVNMSLVPTGAAKAGNVSLVSKSTVDVVPGKSFEVPVTVNSDMVVGAMSLKFDYNKSAAQFEGISLNNNLNLVTRENNGEITIAWADFTGGNKPLNLKANQVIGVIKFNAKTNIENSNFSIDLTEGEIVDAEGNAQKSVSLLVPNFSAKVPSEFALKQNYPNPFNPSTTISYAIPEAGNVTITIYNVTGQQVAKLVNGVQNAGSYKTVWNASNLSSGIYFYELSFEGVSKTYSNVKSMILLK